MKLNDEIILGGQDLFDEQDLKMIDDKSDSEEQTDDDVYDPYLKLKI